MMNIQNAGPADLDALAPLFDAYRQFYGQQPDLAAARIFLEERMLRSESVILLALDDERPAGFTQLYPIFTSVGLRRTWLLNDLYVAPEARKKGLATSLLEAAKAHARSTGAPWLLLETASDNFSAQALYEKNGWSRTTDLFYQFGM